MHSVLRGEHVGRDAASDQAVEQRAVETTAFCPAAQHRGGKLLMIADQNQLAASFHDGDQGTGFGGLGSFVHQHDGELPRRQQSVTAPDGGGANHLGFIEDAGRHRVLHAANFLVVDVDVAMHQPFLFASQGRQRLAQLALFVLQERQFFLHGVVFQHRIERRRPKMLSNLHRPSDSERFHAQVEQAFEQVVHGNVGFCRSQQRPTPLLGKVMEQVRGRGGFPGTGGALNEGQTAGKCSLDGRLLGRVEMAVGRERAPLKAFSANVGRKFGALVDVEHVAQDELAKHRPAVTLR